MADIRCHLHKPFVYGKVNVPSEEYPMKWLILPVCLVLSFLLLGAGMPTAASPIVTDIRPISAPNSGDVTATITGTGFTTESSVWMTPASICDPTNKIFGSDCSWGSTSATCTFPIQGQTSGTYTVWVNTPTSKGLPDPASLSRHFQIYQGSGTYPISSRTVTTTYASAGPYGTIYVESSPSGAVISVNGENKGTAPVTITGLWPGSYTVSAEMAGFQKYTTTTTISGSTRSSVYCALLPDSSTDGLYVMSNPDQSKVYLDGILKGETPLLLTGTSSGSHTLQVKHPGYDEWKSTAWIPSSGSKTVSAILIQNSDDLPQGMNVSSNPGGAEVTLDGLKKGVTPVMLNNIAAGIHIVEIGYPGYTSWKSTVDIQESEMKELSVNLTPKAGSSPGSITVSSTPYNALVTLDGIYIGQTPANSSLNLGPIPPGEHIVGLAISGYKPYSTNVTVSLNLTSMVNVTLIPVSGPSVKGALSVVSDPAGAVISLDNTSLGMSPLTANDIAAGNHVVTITLDGYEDYSTSILVMAGTTRNVSASLLKVPTTLHSPGDPLIALGALGLIGLLTLRKR